MSNNSCEHTERSRTCVGLQLLFESYNIWTYGNNHRLRTLI